MIKRWKEYSYVLCLGISAVFIIIIRYTEFFSYGISTGSGEYSFLEQNSTFVESENALDIAERLERLREIFSYEILEGFLGKQEKTTEGTKGEVLEEAKKEEAQGSTLLEEKKTKPPVKDRIGEEKKRELLARQKGREMFQKRKERVPVMFTSDSSYFNDALFIGDSRTEGLREYGKLGQAVVLANSGMSVYRLWKEEFQVEGQKQSLEQVLTHKKFGKVYLMLGVNELGYDLDQTIKKFRETLLRIEEAQPEAFIFLQANLHVTDEKAKNSEIYNNENIDRMNQQLEELAKERGYIYLDVNPLFDDDKGSLSREYTVDHAHILGIYYRDWVNWILQHCAK